MRKIQKLLLLLFLLCAIPVSAQQWSAPISGDITDSQCVTQIVHGETSLRIQVSGTWTGFLHFEVASDSIYVDEDFLILPVSAPPAGANAISNGTAINGNWVAAVTGITKWRACGTPITSGSAHVTLTASPNSPLLPAPYRITKSALNSTTAPLGSSGTFFGTVESVVAFSEIDMNVFGLPSTATGTLFFEFSPDGTHWDVSVPLPVLNPSLFVPQHLRVILPFFRIRYVNNSVALTELRVSTIFHSIPATRLTRFLNQSIDNSEGVTMVGAVIKGLGPDGQHYLNVQVDSLGRVVTVSVVLLIST